MTRSHTVIATVRSGFIIGGAIGNGIEPFGYGARVVRFALFHARSGKILQLVRVTFRMWILAIVAWSHWPYSYDLGGARRKSA